MAIPLLAVAGCGGSTELGSMGGIEELESLRAALVAPPPAGPPAGGVASAWSTQMAGSSSSDLASSVALDPSTGAIVHAGSTMGPLLQPFLGGLSDAYVISYDASGNVIWSDQFGTGRDDTVAGVATDAAGNVYLAGITEGNLPGAMGRPNPTPGFDDVYLRKYDATGNLLWTRQFGGRGEDTVAGIAISPSKEIYVVGSTDALLPRAAGFAGGRDYFLLKFDARGTLLAVEENGSAGDEFGSAVAVGPDGSVYITGSYDGGAPGGAGGASDLFVAKYDPTLSLVWLDRRGTRQDDRGVGIAVNTFSEVYVAGTSTGNFGGALNAGGLDTLVLRYAPGGARVWSDLRGTAADDFAFGISINASDGPISVGLTRGDLDGAVNAGGDDAFIMQHERGGAHDWTSLLGTSASELAAAVACDTTGGAFVVGYTTGNLAGLPNAGAYDAFTAKFDRNGLLQ
jgi:hypothetical protein